MPFQRLSTTDAFVVVDLDGAEHADGVVRWAKKVLPDGARTLARSRTYAWAVLGVRASGASAGINAAPEARADAVAAAVGELTPRIADGSLWLDAGKGVAPADLAPWVALDRRPAVLAAPSPAGAGATVADDLLAAGVVASAAAAAGSLDGRTVALEGAGAAGPALVRAVAAAGGRVVAVGTAGGTTTGDLPDPAALADAWAEAGDGLPGALGGTDAPAAVLEAPADVLLCGSRAGLVDHDVAARLPQRAVVPLGPVPLTARGLAVAARRDVVVVPDFISTAGPLAGRVAAGAAGDVAPEALVAAAGDRIGALAAEVLGDGPSAFLAACGRAEAFLSTWCEALPFGRPLA